MEEAWPKQASTNHLQRLLLVQYWNNGSNTTVIFISLHRIQVEGVDGGLLQRVVIVTQNRNLKDGIR